MHSLYSHFGKICLFTIYCLCGLLLVSNEIYAETATITTVVSLSQEKNQNKPLYNRAIEGKVFIWISTSAKNIENVTFWLDDPTGKGRALNVDRWPPFDLIDRKHKRHNMRPRAFDTTKRENGEHSLLTKFVFKNGSSARMLTPFTIFNEGNIPYAKKYKQQRLHSKH